MRITHYKIAGMLVPAALLFAIAAPAFATSVSVGVSTSTTTNGTTADTKTKAVVKLSALDAKAVTKANAEIEKRVADLTSLSVRINATKRLSVSVKANLTTSIQSMVTDLTNLKTKIATDTAADLKVDLQSITKSYRVYALIVPQIRILVAAERADTIADMAAAHATKLQTRIAAATTAGKDTTALVAAQADTAAKLADVKIQTTAAVGYVSNLKADNGDKAVADANTEAIKKARADLRVAESDLKAAQKNSKMIIKALKDLEISTKAGASLKVTQ